MFYLEKLLTQVIINNLVKLDKYIFKFEKD